MSTMIAGCGFARMAWELAQSRSGQSWLSASLRFDFIWGHAPSVEYYRILDNAWDAWNTRSLSSDPSYTVRL